MENAVNNIYGNLYHEIKSISSGQIIAGTAAEGGRQNNIKEDGYASANEMLIYEGSSYSVMAEDNWWGGIPVGSDFYGSVDYLPYLSQAASKSASGGELPLKQRIIAAREKLNSDFSELTVEDFANLYVLQLADRLNKAGELSQTLSAIAMVRDRGIQRVASGTPVIHPAAERAMLIEIQDALRNERYADTQGYLDRYGEYISGRKERIEMLFSKVSVLGEAKSFTEARRLVRIVRGLSREEDRIESALEIIEGELIDRIEENTGIRMAPKLSETYSIPEFYQQTDAKLDGESTDILSIYPNPFNPTTTIPFRLSDDGVVELSVHDAIGRRVAVLAKGFYKAGSHSVHFSVKNLSSGTYLIRFIVEPVSGSTFSTSRIVILQK